MNWDNIRRPLYCATMSHRLILLSSVRCTLDNEPAAKCWVLLSLKLKLCFQSCYTCPTPTSSLYCVRFDTMLGLLTGSARKYLLNNRLGTKAHIQLHHRKHISSFHFILPLLRIPCKPWDSILPSEIHCSSIPCDIEVLERCFLQLYPLCEWAQLVCCVCFSKPRFVSHFLICLRALLFEVAPCAAAFKKL